jgi:predicted lipoprotein with Yx(FWY)xxD motif
MRKFALTVAVVAAAMLGLTACGPNNDEAAAGAAAGQVASAVAESSPTPSGSPSVAPAPLQRTTPSDEDRPGTVLAKVVDTPRFGQILVDAQGMTVYRYDKDTSNPPKSNCEGKCIVKWPPIKFVPGASIQGISPGLIGKVVRTDGSEQLTIAGWPAYRFWNDKVPGDVKGQGVGKTWWAVTAEGKRAREISVDTGTGY